MNQITLLKFMFHFFIDFRKFREDIAFVRNHHMNEFVVPNEIQITEDHWIWSYTWQTDREPVLGFTEARLCLQQDEEQEQVLYFNVDGLFLANPYNGIHGH